mmetsp:Transcript_8524/g.23707  ORF Transcript_8524/g.23707 Transcript_8524/m.23707 type:complete len:204 (+) Transcript_8524:1657-2268(+)
MFRSREAVGGTTEMDSSRILTFGSFVFGNLDARTAILRDTLDRFPSFPDEHANELLRNFDCRLHWRALVDSSTVLPLSCTVQHLLHHLLRIIDALWRTADVHKTIRGIFGARLLGDIYPRTTLLLQILDGFPALANQHPHQLVGHLHDVGIRVVHASLTQRLVDHPLRAINALVGSTEVHGSLPVWSVILGRLRDLDARTTVL